MSHTVYEDWYDLNSETNEILKLSQSQKNSSKKECNMCKKYMDYILLLEKSVHYLKNTQTIVYKNEDINRKTIL
jgi:hypothetical protein